MPKLEDLRHLLGLLGVEAERRAQWEAALGRCDNTKSTRHSTVDDTPSSADWSSSPRASNGRYKVFVGKEDRLLRIFSLEDDEEFMISLPPGLSVEELRSALNEGVDQNNDEYRLFEVERTARLSEMKVEEIPPTIEFARRFYEEVVRPDKLQPEISEDDFMSSQHVKRVRAGESFPNNGYLLSALRLSKRLSATEKANWEWEWHRMQSGLDKSDLLSLPEFCRENNISIQDVLASASRNSLRFIAGEVWIRSSQGYEALQRKAGE